MITEIVVLALVSYRVWRLAAVDTITEHLRDRLADRWCEFLACPWCAGFWVTLAVGLIPVWETTPWLLIPAAAVGVGYLGERI